MIRRRRLRGWLAGPSILFLSMMAGLIGQVYEEAWAAEPIKVGNSPLIERDYGHQRDAYQRGRSDGYR